MIDRKLFAPSEVKLSDKGDVEIAFAQLDVIDRDGDVTLAGAFPAGKAVPMSAYGHTSWTGALPVGKGVISEEDGWALFRGGFFLETSAGREAYQTTKDLGPLAEYSYGYDAREFSFGTRDNQSVRFLKDLDVYEVSPVLVGAGIGTHTRAIKSGESGSDLPFAEHLEAILKEVALVSDRSRSRAEFRAKEGRTLSTATRDRLMRLMDMMREAGDDLAEMLAEHEPPKARQDREIAALAELARFHGVAIR